MIARRIAIVTALALACSTHVALAQAPGAGSSPTPPAGQPPPGAQAPMASGLGLDVDFDAITKAPAGSWADYQVIVKDKSDLPKVRYALVDRTPKSLSLEVSAPTPKGELDMHFDFAPSGDGWAAKSGKMKMGEQSVDLPPAEVAHTPPLKKGATPGDLVGSEDVQTPVGTIACKHYRRTLSNGGQTLQMEFWMSAKVAPTGLVKSTVGPMTLMLAAKGTGAVAKIH